MEKIYELAYQQLADKGLITPDALKYALELFNDNNNAVIPIIIEKIYEYNISNATCTETTPINIDRNEPKSCQKPSPKKVYYEFELDFTNIKDEYKERVALALRSFFHIKYDIDSDLFLPICQFDSVALINKNIATKETMKFMTHHYHHAYTDWFDRINTLFNAANVTIVSIHEKKQNPH